jgi:hypothetical protein
MLFHCLCVSQKKVLHYILLSTLPLFAVGLVRWELQLANASNVNEM